VLATDSSQQPVAFVANAGQWSDGSDFQGLGGKFNVATSATGATLELERPPTAA
jgi:hypothetical protein